MSGSRMRSSATSARSTPPSGPATTQVASMPTGSAMSKPITGETSMPNWGNGPTGEPTMNGVLDHLRALIAKYPIIATLATAAATYYGGPKGAALLSGIIKGTCQ